jgi:hypothetical protein
MNVEPHVIATFFVVFGVGFFIGITLMWFIATTKKAESKKIK